MITYNTNCSVHVEKPQSACTGERKWGWHMRVAEWQCTCSGFLSNPSVRRRDESIKQAGSAPHSDDRL